MSKIFRIDNVMKLCTAVLLGVLGSEIAWHWYTHTVLGLAQLFPLVFTAVLAVICAAIGWGTEV